MCQYVYVYFCVVCVCLCQYVYVCVSMCMFVSVCVRLCGMCVYVWYVYVCVDGDGYSRKFEDMLMGIHRST